MELPSESNTIFDECEILNIKIPNPVNSVSGNLFKLDAYSICKFQNTKIVTSQNLDANFVTLVGSLNIQSSYFEFSKLLQWDTSPHSDITIFDSIILFQNHTDTKNLKFNGVVKIDNATFHMTQSYVFLILEQKFFAILEQSQNFPNILKKHFRTKSSRFRTQNAQKSFFLLF